MAAANTTSWWYSTTTPPSSTDRPAKKSGTLAVSSPGGQITVAIWISATSRPMGTTMRIIGDASWRRRMSSRSMPQPRPGAKPNSVSASASGTGSPHASGELSCQ